MVIAIIVLSLVLAAFLPVSVWKFVCLRREAKKDRLHFEERIKELGKHIQEQDEAIEGRLAGQLEKMVKDATEKTAKDLADAIVSNLREEWRKQVFSSITEIRELWEGRGGVVIAGLEKRVVAVEKAVDGITGKDSILHKIWQKVSSLGRKKGDEKLALQEEPLAAEQTP